MHQRLPVSLILVAALSCTQVFAQAKKMKVRLHVDGQVAIATLDDSAAARDFAALLPLALTLADYEGIERIAELPRKLSVTGAPAGHAPKEGELTYYAPWGNLAIFLGGGAHARGLVRLGQLDSGLAAFQRPAPFKVRIERVPD